MKKSIAIAGNSGPKVRSDCEITLELKSEGGVCVDLASKVKVLYGESIKILISEILEYFGIKNAHVKVVDSGALPFVISARIEAAIIQLIETELQYLPDFIQEKQVFNFP